MDFRHLSKGALAAHLGVATSTVSRWRDAMPRADTIQKTAEWLGVDANWLMTGEGVMAHADATPSAVSPAESVNHPKESGPSPDQFPDAGKMIDLLRDQIAEKDRQIDRLLAIIERQA